MAKTCRRSGKLNYRSESAARAALARVAESASLKRQHVKTEIDCYKCPDCPYWHLTSVLQKHCHGIDCCLECYEGTPTHPGPWPVGCVAPYTNCKAESSSSGGAS